jgi:hypothetical protein
MNETVYNFFVEFQNFLKMITLQKERHCRYHMQNSLCTLQLRGKEVYHNSFLESTKETKNLHFVFETKTSQTK